MDWETEFKAWRLLRGRRKRVSLCFNPELWERFRKEVAKEGKKPNEKLNEMIFKYLLEKGGLDGD